MCKGLGKRAVAKRFGLSESGVYRHWRSHVHETVKSRRLASVLRPDADLEDLLNEEGVSVVENLHIVRAGLQWQYDLALQEGDRVGMAQLAAQLHRNAELVAKLRGELINRSEHVTVSIALQDEVQTLCNELARIVRPYPEVAALVAEKFRTFTRPALPIRPPTLEGAAQEVSHAG